MTMLLHLSLHVKTDNCLFTIPADHLKRRGFVSVLLLTVGKEKMSH